MQRRLFHLSRLRQRGECRQAGTGPFRWQARGHRQLHRRRHAERRRHQPGGHRPAAWQRADHRAARRPDQRAESQGGLPGKPQADRGQRGLDQPRQYERVGRGRSLLGLSRYRRQQLRRRLPVTASQLDDQHGCQARLLRQHAAAGWPEQRGDRHHLHRRDHRRLSRLGRPFGSPARPPGNPDSRDAPQFRARRSELRRHHERGRGRDLLDQSIARGGHLSPDGVVCRDLTAASEQRVGVV